MTKLAGIFAGVLLLANLVLAQSGNTGEIVPGDNLVVDGVPKIPASLAQEVNRYKNSYGYPLAGWGPSKRELWLKILGSADTSIFRVDAPASMPRALLSIPVGGAYDVPKKIRDWLNGGARSPKEAVIKERLRALL